MLFQSWAEFGVCTAATRYFTNATSMSYVEWKVMVCGSEQGNEQYIDIFRNCKYVAQGKANKEDYMNLIVLAPNNVHKRAMLHPSPDCPE